MNWSGKPEFKPYFFRSLISLLKTLFFIGFIYIIVYFIGKTYGTNDDWIFIHGFAIYFGGQGLFSFYKKMTGFKYLQYEITPSIIKIVKGNNETKTKIIDRNKIQFIETKTYISDKFFGTRTLRFYTGEIQNNEDKTKKKFDEFQSINGAELLSENIILEK